MLNDYSLGLKNFAWWIGEIEDRIDPLALGRCRVRIFGYHTDDKAILPTDKLPWCTPLMPCNNSKSFSSPMIGSWVVGFFMDGNAGQHPIIVGVLPAINKDK